MVPAAKQIVVLAACLACTICSRRTFKQAPCGANLSDAAYLLFYSIVFIGDDVFHKKQ
jgi:hypothetical protein